MPELAAYLFLVSLLSMCILTPIAIRLGHRWRVLDFPGERKVHHTPTPLVGGWAIIATLSIVLWGHLAGAILIRGSSLESRLPDQIQYFIDISPSLVWKILPVYAGALSIFLLGLWDDVRGLSVRSRIQVQAAIACLLVLQGLRPQLSFLPSWVAALLGLIWIIGITNSFNFLDGLDGLSTGVALTATLALLTIMGLGNQPHVLFFLAALSGTLLGFLRFNWHPASAFLGSSGSLLIGYLLATSTLLVTYMKGTPGNWLMPLLSPIFVLALPIYDSCSVILIRLIQKRNISIADQSHFHHRLMRLGFSHRQTVAFMILIAFCIALSGVRLIQATLGQSLLILIQILGIMMIIVIAERVPAVRRGDSRPRDAAPQDYTMANTTSENDKQ